MVHRLLLQYTFLIFLFRDKLLDLEETARLRTSTVVVAVLSMVEEDLCQV